MLAHDQTAEEVGHVTARLSVDEIPLVSVVIPVYGESRWLQECVGSVLAQDYPNLEIVVAENCVGQRATEVLESYGDRLRRLEALEVPSLHGNWERGLRAATGRYVKLVCHDDILLGDCISAQVQMIEQHPDAALVSSRRRIIDDRGRVIKAAHGLGKLVGSGGPRLLGGDSVARSCVLAGANLLGEPVAVLMRRSMLPDPMLDERWRYVIDVDLYLRMLRHHTAVLDPEPRAAFRVSPQQLSAAVARQQATEVRAFFSEIAESLDERFSRGERLMSGARSEVLSIARRLLYAGMRLRGRR